MMNYIVTKLVLVILLMGSGQSRSIRDNIGQQSSGYLTKIDYDYTYGDLAYGYDGPISSNGRGHHPPKEISQDSDSGEVNPHKEDEVPTQSARVPHVVIDDTFNYDYTYGDPEVDYHHIVLPSDEDDRDPQDEDHVVGGASAEDERDDDESVTRRGDKNDRKKVSPIVKSIIDWMVRNWEDVKFLQDKIIETKDHVKTSWGTVQNSMKRIGDALERVLKKFGSETEKGLRYCYVRFNATRHVINEQGVQAIDKLETLLEEGNESVASFFRLIGHKVEEITNQYSGHMVDLGIAQGTLFNQELGLSNYVALGGNGDGTEGHDHVIIPNLFEDEDVLRNLDLLVEENILESEQVEALLKAASQQTQSSIHENYPKRIHLL